MKIVYLSSAKIPSRTANSVNVMKMCQALAQNGHETVLFAPQHVREEPGTGDLYEFYGVERCFELRRLPFSRRRLKQRRLLDSAAVFGLIRLQRPDLVWTRDGGLRCYDLHRLGLPVVLELHKLISKDAPRLARLTRSRNFRLLVTTNDALRRAYESEFGIPGERITTAHSAADEPETAEPLDLGSPGRLQVGYVGHLYPGKGIETIAEMASRCSWADFHIIGGTESDLARWRRESQSRENLVFHGYRPPAETDRYRQSMDVLLAPYWRELAGASGGRVAVRGLSPIKLFEYMAAGKAILISDLPVIREVVEDRITAWLCPPEDPASWVVALTHLRDHPELRNALGQKAREAFRSKHTWRARAAAVLDAVS